MTTSEEERADQLLYLGQECKLQLPNPNKLNCRARHIIRALVALNTYRYVAFIASQPAVILRGDHDSLLVKRQNDNHLWQNVIFLSFPNYEYVQSIKKQQQQSQKVLDVS